jgi:hypothetical protein
LARRFNPQKNTTEKLLEMTATDDDPIASWQDRVGTLRKRGRVGDAALTVVPAAELDVRVGRPPAPERLSAEERELWQRLTFSRRPGWFAGAEALLESYVSTVVHVQKIEGRCARPSSARASATKGWRGCIGSRSLWRPRWRRGYG